MESLDPRKHLQQLAAQRRVSLRALSVMLGRNPTYLRQFVSKGSPRKLDENDRRMLAGFFGIDERDLLALVNDSPDSPLAAVEQWVNIPRLALGASAGKGAEVGIEMQVGAFGFSRRWLREQGLDRAQLSAITVDGDSMEPTLRSGDEILVDRTVRPFREGIHVIRSGDTLLVKRVVAARGGGFTLVSDNRAYPPLDLAAEEVEIIGRVVWKSGRL